MEVTRKSLYSGKEHTLNLDITEEQMEMYKKGMHARFAFPNLTKDECEFIVSGITGEEWDEAFGDEDDDSHGQGEESPHSCEERAEQEELAEHRVPEFVGIVFIILHP